MSSCKIRGVLVVDASTNLSELIIACLKIRLKMKGITSNTLKIVKFTTNDFYLT